MPRGGDQTRRLSLLLILATLGAAIILYRLSSSGSRTRPNPRNRPDRGIPIEEPPVDDDDDALGKRIWRRRVVAVGDLHGGGSTPDTSFFFFLISFFDAFSFSFFSFFFYAFTRIKPVWSFSALTPLNTPPYFVVA